MLYKIWKSKEIHKFTKLRVYEVLVLSVILYNAETWTLKESSKRRLRVFEMACLRTIEGVTKRDKIRNTEIRSRLGCTNDIIHRIQQRRLRYFGHISRMANCMYHHHHHHYPKIAMEVYVHGQCSKGRPKRRWIDGLKEDCDLLNLTIQDAGSTAQDRRTWRGLVKELPLRATASPRH